MDMRRSISVNLNCPLLPTAMRSSFISSPRLAILPPPSPRYALLGSSRFPRLKILFGLT